MKAPSVFAVSCNGQHSLSKNPARQIKLVEGLGVEGDAHFGATVKHRSRIARHGDQPNLRQVHLVHLELIEELQAKGFAVAPAVMGENITTCGLDLLALSTGATLGLGEAIIEITGLRNPCSQLDAFQDGLMQAVLGHDPQGGLIRRLGVMAIVRRGGVVTPGDAITSFAPITPHRMLKPV